MTVNEIRSITRPKFSSNWNNSVICSSRSSKWNNDTLNLNSNNASQGCTDTGGESNSLADFLSLLYT